ncbi:MAG: hypothetical protein HOW73_16430 [Polyangiaceae bacterium]|nr:hypothetical protein [Polyangiaceae bacterium]
MRCSVHFVLGLGTVAALGALAEASTPVALPGPGPRARPDGYDVVRENARCEQCHQEIAAEWQSSLHRLAWDDPAFQSAYALEAQSFCRECHAPEHDPEAVSNGARHIGVGCVTCHVQGEQIIGARSISASAGHHAVAGDARLATTSACASCHQFDFREPQRALMQSTVDEHRASPYARETCQSCHMPTVEDAEGHSYRSHDFRVQGDTALLSSAVRAEARRLGDDGIVVSLRAGRVGHAFPTGDLFRRLEVRARIDGDGGPIAKPVVLARRFAMIPGENGPTRIQVGDDRLPANGDPRHVELHFGEEIRSRTVQWEVAYQRMDGPMAQLFGIDPAKDEVIVARGTWSGERSQ